jgi:hypothetical protein
MRLSPTAFPSAINIKHNKPLDADLIWPMNVELAIFRVPIRKKDGYTIHMVKGLATKLKASLAPNAMAFVICYAPSECKSRPFEVASEFANTGLNHVDNIVVERTWKPGKKSDQTLVNTHDYVFFFVNGDQWTIDRSPIKQYMFQPEDQPCVGTTWLVESGALDEAYSDDLAELLVRFADLLPGSAVFDPWMGNNGIVKACLKLGHSLTGFEPDLKKINQYKKLIEEFKLED